MYQSPELVAGERAMRSRLGGHALERPCLWVLARTRGYCLLLAASIVNRLFVGHAVRYRQCL
jgi:hypothetical protein